MKPLEIKAARVRLGLSQKDMAKQLNIPAQTYSNKERGRVRFTDHEKAVVAQVLGLSAAQVNDYFFDGMMKSMANNLVLFPTGRDGLRRKFYVFEADTGEAVENCFVLRPDRDRAARDALRAYIVSTDNLELARDLDGWLNELESGVPK